MTHGLCQQDEIKRIVFISIIMAISLCQGCANPSQTLPYDVKKTAPSNGSVSACIPVEGRVLGDVQPYSVVYVYETQSLHYYDVMSSARKPWPISWALVNESAGFDFPCLIPGKYVFVIKTSSFGRSVGSPLPYEFDCQNISLEIAFQGGDSQYAVGAFSIKNSSALNKSACTEDPSSCLAQKGSLYKKCPLGLG